MIRTLLIDDEADARFTLRNQLAMSCPEIEIVGEAHSVETALNAIAQYEPELIFLDVRLSPGSGFDILKQVSEITFDVIFVTAYDAYAMQAIRFSALDYLLKPVDPEELREAVDKLSAKKGGEEEAVRYEVFKDNLEARNEQFDRIVLPTLEGFLVQEVQEIIRCEADRNYTHFFLQGKKKQVIPRTLKVYDELLGGLGFYRCHQSHLINVKQVREYKRRKKGGIAFLHDGTEIPVSESRKEGFIQQFMGL
ncbi:MAG: LytTR family DNA-binding domain-containing protein [Bacteroidota bacterium]